MTPLNVGALKSVVPAVEEAMEDGMDAARRAVKTGRREFKRMEENFEDMKNEAVHRVKRHPLGTVGAAAGIGMALGLAIGWFVSGMRRRN